MTEIQTRNDGSPSFPKVDMTEPEKAWLAAAIDADGCILLVTVHGETKGPSVQVCNDNYGYCAKAASLMGVKVYSLFTQGKVRHRTTLQGRASAITVLEQIMPYLIIKGDRAQVVIDWCKANIPGDREDNFSNWRLLHGIIKGTIDFTCQQCGKTVQLLPSRAKRRKYCSRKCYYDAKRNS